MNEVICLSFITKQPIFLPACPNLNSNTSEKLVLIIKAMGKKIPKKSNEELDQQYLSLLSFTSFNKHNSIAKSSLKKSSKDRSCSEESHDDISIARRQGKDRKTKVLEMLAYCQPQNVKYREKQISQIEEFLRECERGTKKGSRIMMLTGHPGLGKSLVIKNVLKKVNCKLIHLNANKHSCLKEIQMFIFSKIVENNFYGSQQLSTAQMIRALLKEKQTNPIIVCIQQIQFALRGKEQNDYTHEFLSLFTHRQLKIALIGVSTQLNSLDDFSEKTFNTKEIKKVLFAPYSNQVLGHMILDKFQELRKNCKIQIHISDQLLTYVTKIIQDQKKSDIRIFNNFIKDLVDKVIGQTLVEESTHLNQDVRVEVTMQILQKVLITQTTSKVSYIASLPFFGHTLLLGISYIIQSEDLLFVDQDRVINETILVCKQLGINAASALIRQWLEHLQSYGLVDIKRRKNGQGRVILLVNSKEIREGVENSSRILACYQKVSKEAQLKK